MKTKKEIMKKLKDHEFFYDSYVSEKSKLEDRGDNDVRYKLKIYDELIEEEKQKIELLKWVLE